MKAAYTHAKLKGGFTLIELMVVIAILATLASVGYPAIMDRMNDGDRQKATSNLTQVGSMLMKFKQDNGQYPCDATADDFSDDPAKASYNFGELKGNYSNDYFRQFFYTSVNNSEKNFFAKVICAGKTADQEGDDKIANGQALQPGENGMAYVMRKSIEDPTVKLSISATNAPLAMSSIYPSDTPYVGDQFNIDNTSFKGHFFVLRADGSVKDLEKDLVENDEDPERANIVEGKSIFPQNKRGRNMADRYVILSPEI